jgi:hypothetical protein
MDKDVLIRFIAFLEVTLGRLNSKRLTSFFALLVFLPYAPVFDTQLLACGAWLFLLLILNQNPRGDGLSVGDKA